MGRDLVLSNRKNFKINERIKYWRITIIFVGWALVAHADAADRERMYADMISVSGCLQARNAWAASAHPTKPKIILKKEVALVLIIPPKGK